jgi:hypothetical protein
MGRADCEAQFRAKVLGLPVLQAIFKETPLDFWLLSSSLSVVLGGLGLSAYSASNSFVDAFAHRRNQLDRVPWISLAWDGWRPSDPPEGDSLAPSAPLAMSSEEGIETVVRVLTPRSARQVVVSTGDLRGRLARRPAPLPRATAAGDPSHPRPAVAQAYVPPRSLMEQRVSALWQSLLGIDHVGIHDNFFELGGHSLLAIELAARLGTMLDQDVGHLELFEYPTVEALARHLSPTPSKRAQSPARHRAKSQAPDLLGRRRARHLGVAESKTKSGL